MANVTYKVVKGDTLSEIAVRYNTTVAKLVELNHIKNPNYIVVGQVLIISGTASPVTTNKSAKPIIEVFGLQSNTDRTVYATWSWSKSNTDHYEVSWHYATGDGVWFVGDDSTTTYKQSLYTAPSNATKVKFKVKPISKKRKVNGKESAYWTASWSTAKTYNFSNNPPLAPGTPDVSIVDFTLTASLENLDLNATHIQFQVVKNNTSVFKTGNAAIKTGYASFACTISAGSSYKVRCRSYKGKTYSAWSEYSSNQNTIPEASSGILVLKALSQTSVSIDWATVANATGYEIEYTTKKMYFDSSKEVQSLTIESVASHAEITGLETGEEWFFRVRAVNKEGKSPWTEIKSIIIGKKPAAPTTWSSTTTAITGELVTLYWIHNAEDGSNQTYAELELYINGKKESYTIDTTADAEAKENYTRILDTSDYTEGSKIQWRVRTAGITKVYGDWSTQRTIDVYSPPTLELSVKNPSGELIDTLTSFPFIVTGLAGPKTQKPIGYYLTIISNEIYETVDNVGNVKMVNIGEAVYAKHFDTSSSLAVRLSAYDMTLENNVEYTVNCTVSMNSGLTAEASSDFVVSWTEEEYTPDAEIAIDKETLVAYIRPYCWDTDATLSVYRRDFDGGFTELATNIDNNSNTFITDPHPALDYARYRVVAKSKTTGNVSYYDVPGYPVGETAVIIQWNEEWSYFDTTGEDDELEQPPWAGSMLKLPYNIDVSDNHSPDVSLVEYIGRSHPVSYYGTQRGESATWSVAIDKKDEETLYALRRLRTYPGNVYVREPSGSGYWASVTVSFSQKHLDLTIPVTLDIKRVEGGA